MADGSVCVIAGELSGDQHAAELVRELRRRRPELEVWGIGGDHLQAAGMSLTRHCRDMAVMGIWEVLKRYGFFRAIFRDVVTELRARRPSLVLLVDYPGFNLRLAKELRGSGIPVVQYVCPQVWAWKKGRIKTMAEVLDEVLCLFPFEPRLFDDTPLTATFVGHPLVASVDAFLATPSEPLPWVEGTRKIGLLPGSRSAEVERLLPTMLAAAAALQQQQPGVSFVLPASDADRAAQIEELLAHASTPQRFAVVVGRAREVMRQADAAWIASGTATLEAGLIGCPMVIVYRTAWLTYAIGKRVVKIDHVGLVNILAGKEICPELLQHAANPEALVAALAPLLAAGEEPRAMREALGELKQALGAMTGPGPAVDRLLVHVSGDGTNG